ncbi:hypothetical protein ABBQ32_010959 [Trebouxia sp. C0010 RCD-2024]
MTDMAGATDMSPAGRQHQQGQQDSEAGKEEDVHQLQAAAMERVNSQKVVIPTASRRHLKEVDVRKLTKSQKNLMLDEALQSKDNDAERFLGKVKERMDRAGIDLATVEVRMNQLKVEANIAVGSRGNPTVTNTVLNIADGVLHKLHLKKLTLQPFTMIDTMNSILYPGRFTLLLGPPGAGKSTLLNALAGRLHKSSTVTTTGDITYNGKGFDSFRAVHTAAYVDQNDLHQPELTVRETFNFAARCQGTGYKAEELEELRKKEKEAGYIPDWELDAFMKAEIRKGKRESIVTDLVIKLLGLDVCSETLIGNDQIRGVSGGQRKRVTTGELLVSPKKTLFLDEISTGLDSATTFQIMRTLRHFAHLRQATMLIALLQPTPEVYHLFDDIMLLSEGNLVFHGPREQVVPFFESMHFFVPERKAVSDFLQEVTSKKDQKQYYRGKGKWEYMPVVGFAKAFDQTEMAQGTRGALAQPYQAPNPKCEEALIQHKYALNGLQRWKALMQREFTLIKRTIVVYKAKSFQILVMGLIAATLFLRTHIHPISPNDGQEIAGFTFFGLLVILFNGIAEMSMAVERLPVFWKHQRLMFFDAFSFAFPAALQRVPYSLLVSLIWTVVTYFPVGLAPQPSRFFMFWAIVFVTHQVGVCVFRCTAMLSRNIVVANGMGMLTLLCFILLDGFVIVKRYIHPWVVWIYWINPLQYAQKAIIINEFSGGHWQNKNYPYPPYQGLTLGDGILRNLDMENKYWWVWLGIGVNLAYILLMNMIIIVCLAYLPAYGSNATVAKTEEELEDRHQSLYGDADSADDIKISMPRNDNADGTQSNGNAGNNQIPAQVQNGADSAHPLRGNQQQSRRDSLESSVSFAVSEQSRSHSQTLDGAGSGQPRAAGKHSSHSSRRRTLSGNSSSKHRSKKQLEGEGMVLPFEPMTMTFKDLHYWVQIPKEGAKDRDHVHMEGNTPWLELLLGISGAFRPKVLTCLMGVTGAGKTTLMDVLAGRKTGGRIEGEVRINGHPKEQDSFARVSGYVEQFDTHSAAATVHEALMFSGTLRNEKDIDRDTTEAFVDQVMDLVELRSLAGAIVGRAGESGLSVEQRKRLTIAVELVANPSIVFMDEPTSGLDARAAAIVMRTVRNIVNTGRTIVCTIHQPSIDIFEAFDELLLLKRGGECIFNGQLGKDSGRLVEYFAAVPGVPAIQGELNPATWMLEITTPGMEHQLGVDFAQVYRESDLAKQYDKLLDEFSSPKEGTKALRFDSKYPKPFWVQFQTVFHKYSAAYWRMPEYNGMRFFYAISVGFLFGAIFWRNGDKLTTQAGLTNVLGALYASVLFFAIINALVVQPVINAERAVSYRERAAGMYSFAPWTLALGCVEILYISVQTIIFTSIVYWMCWFQRDAGKFFWFLLFTYLTQVYFTFFGMIAVALTPNMKIAAVCSSYMYSLFHLFAGFVITQVNMPGWWIWVSYLNPIFWTVYGLIESQVYNLSTTITLNSGEAVPAYEAVLQIFGYHRGMLGWIVLILVAWCGICWGATYLALSRLNFLKR